ncbi:MAG: HNH endonuclease signature motif containing protein [Pseudomonadales bacterium]
MTAIIKDGDRVLNVGRKHRLVPPKLRQALAARDRHCQFPGCHHTQFLDAHHIEHWCDGGETKLDNLILLCSHHHMLMHEGGFSLKPRGDRFYFARPDGRPIELPSSAEDGEQDEVELH